MSSPATFIINTEACDGANQPWLERNMDTIRAMAGGGRVTVTCSGEEIAVAVREAVAARHAMVVGAGGDGTLNAIASHLVGTDVAFGVL
ncbi:MAG TPA: diacylglycerol kinase family protein, partial [Nitrococcus sp.]|nr:diacylglycerol kinase family protein [Nitrococcus sp.]